MLYIQATSHLSKYCIHPTARRARTSIQLLLVVVLAMAMLVLAACGKTQVQSPQQADRSSKGTPSGGVVGRYWATSLSGDYAGYGSLQRFIDKMAVTHGFQREYLYGLFSQAQRKDWTLNYFAKSDRASKGGPSPGGWTRYRAKFLDELHISKGVEFSRTHQATLERAERQYRVPREYILGILAVETKFGGYLGNHRIIDALTTLSFDYPRRSEFFTGELEAFLLMSRSEGFDPSQPEGSFAGAMGLGQFMPSSFIKYAVDFNSDGRRDLWNPEDAIGSIANYFVQHGWRPAQPVVAPLKTNGSVALEPGLKTSYSLDEIARAGARLLGSCNTDDPVNLLLLRHARYDQYLLGCPNFYTISRYNNSVYYAMTIHELAQAIKDRSSPSPVRAIGQTAGKTMRN